MSIDSVKKPHIDGIHGIFPLFSVVTGRRTVVTSAVTAMLRAHEGTDGEIDTDRHCRQKENIRQRERHTNNPPSWYTTNAQIHATAHWSTTTPMVWIREPSSRRIAATAATQGVYSSVNTRNDTADSG